MVQLAAEASPIREVPKPTQYFDISKYSDVNGEDILLFDYEGVKLQVMNVYDVGMGFGHRTELSALRKLIQMLQNETPKWSSTELVVITEFCELVTKDSLSEYVYLLSECSCLSVMRSVSLFIMFFIGTSLRSNHKSKSPQQSLHLADTCSMASALRSLI